MATFKHIDPTSYTDKPWAKVDGPGKSYSEVTVTRPVTSIRGNEKDFTTDNAGFQILTSPATEKLFTDDNAVRTGYYPEVEELLKKNAPSGKVKKVHIFDHTIRRRTKDAPRQPVQQVHVDQSRGATIARIKRHLPEEEWDSLINHRFQIINVWRPIENPASDYPLAVVDWRSTSPSDFIPVDLLYPKRADSVHDDDDRGKEKLPASTSHASTENYEVKGETLGVAPNEKHRFFYQKDMTTEEVCLLKCYDSFGEGEPDGKSGVAVRTPHTAFVDPGTPEGAPGRQSIEVRCLVFYE